MMTSLSTCWIVHCRSVGRYNHTFISINQPTDQWPWAGIVVNQMMTEDFFSKGVWPITKCVIDRKYFLWEKKSQMMSIQFKMEILIFFVNKTFRIKYIDNICKTKST